MLEVLLKALGLICIIVLGYTLKKIGFFKPKDYILISKIALNITLPGAVITSFSKFSPDFSLLWVVAIGLACNLIMAGVGYLVARKRDNCTKAFYMINFTGYNIGCFALPFIQNFLGAYGVVVTCMFDVGNSIMCTGGSYALAQGVVGTEKGGLKRALKALATSVPLLVYILMFAIVMAGLKLPEFVVNVASTVGGANAFVAMLMIGMMFELTLDKQYLKDAVKTLAWRYGMAAVFACLLYFCTPFPLEVRQVLAILVCGPIASMAPVFTERCKGNVALAGMINSFAIVISTVLMTVLIMAMHITG
ncbi:AEC family transporter [Christensenella tenuis]|jgi:malate permease and related proteins|uniref:AEC family transporter n=1 Tax=Christensenella tenuis TaxID=2763033 RepID=A0ABR7EEN3_9FIRM|nr:AEC family transporter [Christensenella tenuis]MBC5648228.1 AEC family transporter [Christensenella tenuis]